MNRKIKFRAWDSVHNRMIYSDKHSGYMPFDGNCFCNYDFNISKKGVYCFAYDEYDDDFGSGVCNETDLPIMQYTGLKDKNGVEIYEGDICKGNEIRDKNHLFIIKYGKYKTSYWKEKYISNTYQYGWFAEFIKTKEQVHLVTPNGIEVIGNIYENEVD